MIHAEAGGESKVAGGGETAELWREVFTLAASVWRLAPWTFMDEMDLFGVEEPTTKELGFVSVMGALGEHHAVAVYRGARGLYDFLALEGAQGDVAPARFLDMPQVQLSFETRGMLERQDRDLLARYGSPAMPWKSWPMVRSYRAACMPWFAEPDELRLLVATLGQLLEMAPRIERDATFLRSTDGPGVLVRARSGAGPSAAWGESFVSLPPPEPDRINVRIDGEVIAAVRALHESDSVLEIDCFRTETVIAEPGKRPHFPYALLICDAASGLIIGVELLDPTPSVPNMWAGVPQRIAHELIKLGAIPRAIHVADALLAQLLDLIAPGFGFEVARKRRLPALDLAKTSLLQNLGGPLRGSTGKSKKRRR